MLNGIFYRKLFYGFPAFVSKCFSQWFVINKLHYGLSQCSRVSNRNEQSVLSVLYDLRYSSGIGSYYRKPHALGVQNGRPEAFHHGSVNENIKILQKPAHICPKSSKNTGQIAYVYTCV